MVSALSRGVVAWNRLVSEACTSTLLNLFQEPGLHLIRNHLAAHGLRFDDVSAHPERLDAALRNMLGDSGAQFVQLEILKQVYLLGGRKFAPSAEMDLGEELERAKEQFSALAGHRFIIP